MPSRVTLLEPAARASIYICRSCLKARGLGLGLPQQPPPVSLVRPYGRAPRDRAPRDRATTHQRESRTWRDPSEGPLDKGFKVTYFDADETGQLHRVPVGEDDDDVTDEDIKALEASALAKMEKLGTTLEALNEKAAFFEKFLARSGPKGAVEAFKAALESYSNKSDWPGEEKGIRIPLIDVDRQDMAMNRVQVDRTNAVLARLNGWIGRSASALEKDQLEANHVAKTWKFFAQAKAVLSKPQFVVPDKVWGLLWAIFSHTGEGNLSRFYRILSLCMTMEKAGVRLSDEQVLLQIEATYLEGQVSLAIETWKRLVPTLGSKQSSAIAFWEVGVRLWSWQGDMQRAERACKAVLDRASPSTPADSRVLLYLIRAYVSRPDFADKGFKLYRRMRTLAQDLGKPFEIEDYDEVISIFLGSGNTDYAMYAFADMMFAGAVNLYGKTKLPNSVRNIFFFGKWLKRLIGAGDLDGAYQVLVYMQKNGVLAAPIQANGLIGAWLRSKTTINREKAEKLAWAMIRSRQTFVGLRQRERMLEWPVRLYDGRPSQPGHDGQELDYAMAPCATSETFIIMAMNYRERGLFTRLEELFVAYKECEIGGDALMMNELILAAVQQERSDKALELYRMMVHEYNILPDTDTHVILFKSVLVHRRRPQFVFNATQVIAECRAQARSFFNEMMTASWLYQDGRRARYGGLSEENVLWILHTFRKCDDWAGLYVALECLRDVMGFHMTRRILLEMIAKCANIDRPSLRKNRTLLSATMKLSSLVQQIQQRELTLRDKRGNEAKGNEAKWVHKPPDEVKDPPVLYKILLEYLWKEAVEAGHELWYMHSALEAARKDMGAIARIEVGGSPGEASSDLAD